MERPEITEPIDWLSLDVWEKGYSTITENGEWFELYVNSDVKENYPALEDIEDVLSECEDIKNLYLGDYSDYNQITFSTDNPDVIEEITDMLI